MNGLSWFLYVADIVQSMKIAFGVGGALVVILLIVNLIRIATNNEGYANANSQLPYRPAFKVAWIAAPLFLICALIPSKETIYLIAGSEAGEAVVTSAEGQKILNDIREVISAQLDNLKKSD